ncbi:MAG: hypothetical protein NC200_05890 [Candidatus Gastranaerophilales bacterium]|nr:hypothetical protein [Candidatus Gastranaerophilales bacterium]
MAMIDNKLPPNMRVIDETLLYPVYPSGQMENQDAIIRYRHSNLKEPILKLVDYIYDYNGNYIEPGMYELALSDDKEFLLLIESHKLIAVIPVFKLAQNEAEVQRIQEQKMEHNKKRKKRSVKYQERVQEILRQKYALESITPAEQDYTYMNAEIEYIEEGGYYLLTYENGMFRAWGAIKVRNKFGGKTPEKLREKSE